MSIDVNRSTEGIVLPKEVSREVLANTQKESAIMQLARRVKLPGSGIEVPIITSDPRPEWVAETEDSPVSTPGFSSKTMRGYTVSVIVPMSNQFRRDLPALHDEIVKRIPALLGARFDESVFSDGDVPGSDFDSLGSIASRVYAWGNWWETLVSSKHLISSSGARLNGWAFSATGESVLLTETDNNGRPLFINSTNADGAVPAILGASTHITDGVESAGSSVLGYAGDWRQAVYGVVDGVKVDVSDQATLVTDNGTINLWQKRMFAVMVTAEFGFRVKGDGGFVQIRL